MYHKRVHIQPQSTLQPQSPPKYTRFLVSTALLLVATGIFACNIVASAKVSAHVLKTDGSIGVVLHIDPNDAPKSTIPANIVLAFNDANGKLSPAECDCSLTISEAGRVVAQQQLSLSSGLVSSTAYTFPEPNVYTLQVNGVPKQSGAFQPFTLSYNVRVTNGQAAAQHAPLVLWVGIGVGIGAVLVVGGVMEYNGRTVRHKTKGRS